MIEVRLKSSERQRAYFRVLEGVDTPFAGLCRVESGDRKQQNFYVIAFKTFKARYMHDMICLFHSETRKQKRKKGTRTASERRSFQEHRHEWSAFLTLLHTYQSFMVMYNWRYWGKGIHTYVYGVGI